MRLPQTSRLGELTALLQTLAVLMGLWPDRKKEEKREVIE